MNAYPDASFVFSLYVDQVHTPAVRAHLATMTEPLPVGSLLRLEVGNAIRREAQQRKITDGAAVAALAAFDADVDAGRVVIPPVEWEDVHAEAERLSNEHGLRRGDRAFDVLHVATALTLGAKVLLTFDGQQAVLGVAQPLRVGGGRPVDDAYAGVRGGDRLAVLYDRAGQRQVDLVVLGHVTPPPARDEKTLGI